MSTSVPDFRCDELHLPYQRLELDSFLRSELRPIWSEVGSSMVEPWG
jgi:hypothetical protein